MLCNVYDILITQMFFGTMDPAFMAIHWFIFRLNYVVAKRFRIAAFNFGRDNLFFLCDLKKRVEVCMNR